MPERQYGTSEIINQVEFKFFYCITLLFWGVIWAVAECWLEGSALVLLRAAHKAEARNQHLETQKLPCAKCSSLGLGSYYLWEVAQNMCRSFPLPREYFEMSGFWHRTSLCVLQLLGFAPWRDSSVKHLPSFCFQGVCKSNQGETLLKKKK